MLTALLFSVHFSFAQDFNYPSITKTAKNTIEFIPAGWALMDSATGDLNKDGKPDIAIVLQHIDSISIINTEGDTLITQPRILIILFQSANKTLYLEEQSNSLIIKHDEPRMEDPYQDITIDKGLLQIDFQIFYNWGGWTVITSSYKFRFQNGEFELIGADYNSFNRASLDFESYSYNFLTGKRKYTKGSDENSIEKTYWKTLKIGKLKTLKTFKEPFSWEVEEDVYL